MIKEYTLFKTSLIILYFMNRILNGIALLIVGDAS